MEIVVRTDVSGVAHEAAERVVASSVKAIAARGRFTLVLAGGSTPAALYELLASPDVAPRVDWSRTHVFFGDERCVPPEHEWSNYGMARRTLLDRVPVPAEVIHRIHGENGPANAANDYATTIGRLLAPAPGAEPRFDLILLGMGDDGHTASLFPGMAALSESDAWVVGTAVPGYVRPQVPRVTVTLPVLNEARAVLFLVTGNAKADTVRRVLGEGSQAGAERTDPEGLPAARVQPSDGLLTWLLDEPAASLLEKR